MFMKKEDRQFSGEKYRAKNINQLKERKKYFDYFEDRKIRGGNSGEVLFDCLFKGGVEWKVMIMCRILFNYLKGVRKLLEENFLF
jgi:hypothetical protein